MMIFWLNQLYNMFSSVAQSCLTLCDPMNRSTPGLPVHHQLLEFTQTHIHRVCDAIQPSHPLSSPFPPAPNPSHEKCFFWSFSCHRKCCFRPWQVRGWQATLSLGATRLDSTLWSFLSLLGFSAWNSVLAENRNTNEHQKEDTKMSDSKPFVRSPVSQVFFWLSSPVWGAPLSDF